MILLTQTHGGRARTKRHFRQRRLPGHGGYRSHQQGLHVRNAHGWRRVGLEAYIKREIPLGRLQSAEEIAAAIGWLLSDDARGVTGEALNVSAGQTMV